MAGTITQATPVQASGFIRQTFTWTCDASGNVNGPTFDVVGAIMSVTTDPGSPAPTDNYDVTIINASGVDVLAGAGVDRDTANSEQIIPASPPSVFGPVEIRIANAGDATSGILVLLLKV